MVIRIPQQPRPVRQLVELLVCAVIVFAAPRPTQAQDEEDSEVPGSAGYDPDSGFLLRSEDGNWELRPGLQAGYRFQPTRRNGEWQDRPSFFVLRPFLGGHAIKPWIKFWTSFEFASNPPFLLDSYVELRPIEELGFRIGQQWTPLSRHEYFGPHEILFPDWNAVAEYFWTGRDKGITALGALNDGEIEYWLGLYSGSPLRQFTTLAGNFVIEGRVTINPLGPILPTEFPYMVLDEVPFGVSFTAQGYYGELELAEANLNPGTFRFDVVPTGETREQAAGSIDAAFQWDRFAGLAEGYFRKTTPDTGGDYTSLGVWGQLGVMLIPRTLDAAIRLSWLDPSRDLSNDRLIGFEGQVAYWLAAPHFQVKARYAVGDQNTPGDEALGPVTLPIIPGRVHLFTLQLMLAL